ncbi:MAG: hypothetical protein F9K23_16595 [Bacteroidetes bacterium]|nr:MAG: hypothetical protein F9K23_16595 [Bacteroidota bacterium]
MITKEVARKLAEEYLKQNSRDFTFIDSNDKIYFEETHVIPFGAKLGEVHSTYSIGFGEVWGDEVKVSFVMLDAKDGAILYLITPQKFVNP